jgi:hypothetical protein
VIGVDASQFDQNFPTFVADEIFDILEEYIDEDLVKLWRLMWRAPVFCPSPVDEDPTQWAFLGDPFDLRDFKANRGLPSGIAWNPDFGKMWGTAYILFMLDDLFGDVLEFGIPKILNGEHPGYATLNQGDDALILTKSMEMRRKILDLLGSGDASPYIQLEVEDPVTFLGWVLTYNGSEYRVYPNVQSMILNFFGNEHSVGHPKDDFGHRKHWGLGVESWEGVFGECPEYEKVRKIAETVVATHTGKTISGWAAPFARMSREVLRISGLTPDEARFLEKPERRFYSVDENKVRDEIMNEVVRTVSPDELTMYCKKFIKNSYL